MPRGRPRLNPDETVRDNPNEYYRKYFKERREMTVCECGKKVSNFSRAKHLNSKSHLFFIGLNNICSEIQISDDTKKQLNNIRGFISLGRRAVDEDANTPSEETKNCL